MGDPAETLLKTTLADGPEHHRDIAVGAHALGITGKQLKAAAARIGIIRHGDGTWSLPAPENTTPERPENEQAPVGTATPADNLPEADTDTQDPSERADEPGQEATDDALDTEPEPFGEGSPYHPGMPLLSGERRDMCWRCGLWVVTSLAPEAAPLCRDCQKQPLPKTVAWVPWDGPPADGLECKINNDPHAFAQWRDRYKPGGKS